MNNFKLVDTDINKINYQVYELTSDEETLEEKLQVKIEGKSGKSKSNPYKRVVFIDIFIEGSIEELEQFTRDLAVESQFTYMIDEHISLNKETEENLNNEVFRQSLKEINKVIQTITSLDKKNPLNIDTEIENFSVE